MKQQTYLKVSGTVFFIVALVHAWRLLVSAHVVIGHTTIPLWVSWAGIILAGYLAYQGLRKR